MGRRGVRERDPSPSEIAERAAEIRMRWSKEDARKRDEWVPYVAPVLDPHTIMLERPIVRMHY